jgi:protein-tyrosine phosphatase
VTLRLLPPGAHTGFLGDLCVPDELYWVARTPVALAGMKSPGRADWSLLSAAGIGHVVCLTHDVATYDPVPCTVTAIKLQDLVSGGAPDNPERERMRVFEAAADVVTHIERGIGVAVHCMGGRGRTGTVLGVALVRLGHEPEAVVTYLDAMARARSKLGWPESPWQAEVVRSSG